MTSNRRLKRTLFLLALVTFAAHSFALAGLLPGALPSSGDTVGAFMPWHEFARRAFWERGEMPLWNPHLYCGVPFLSNGQSGLLYPPNLVFLLLPENVALWLFAFSHSFLFMVGGYVLGRTLGLKRRASFVMALLFGVGGATPAHLFGGHLTYLPVRSFWPWEALFLLRLLRGQGKKNAVGLAACLALGLAAGAPQLWLFGLLICTGIFIFWSAQTVMSEGGRHAGRWKPVRSSFLLTAVLAALWCAPLLLPLQELKDWSSHGDALTFAQVSDLSATWRSLFRLLFDDFFGGNSIFMWSLRSNAGEDAASIGLAAFLLALCAPVLARKSRVVPALFAFCSLALLLALGDSTPFYRLLYNNVALFQNTRVPARWLELWAFGATILAGYSFDGLLRQPQKTTFLRRILWTAGAACLALFVAVLLTHSPWETGTQIILRAVRLPTERTGAIAHGLQLEALVSCAVSGLSVALLAWFLRTGRRRTSNPLVIILIVAVPMGSFWHSTRVSMPASVQKAHLPHDVTKFYQHGERWIVRAPFGRLNAPLTAGIDALNGYEPFGSAPFFEFASAAQPGAEFQADFQPQQMTPLWRVAGVSHVLWQAKFEGNIPQGFLNSKVIRRGLWNLEIPQDGLTPWPRAYLSHNTIAAVSTERYAVLKRVAASSFQEPYPVVVEPDFPAPHGATAIAPMTVTSGVTTPDVLEWQISTPQDAVFVHQAALAPGWAAYVDGQRTVVHRVNGFFRGIPVPANAQKVALVYDSGTLRFSLFLALLGLSLSATVGIGLRAKSRP